LIWKTIYQDLPELYQQVQEIQQMQQIQFKEINTLLKKEV
jgi:hypothetical protein